MRPAGDGPGVGQGAGLRRRPGGTRPRSPTTCHHLVRVLRLQTGEQVVAADGRGGWRMCEYRSDGPVGRGGARRPAGPVGPVLVEARTRRPLTVAFAPAKGDRPEWVVQKLTELGVDRIVVLATRRRSCVGTVTGRRGRGPAAAGERRGGRAVPAGLAPRGGRSGRAGRAGACARGRRGLALAEQGGAPLDGRVPVVAVGPEGGWDPEEIALGLPAVGLGPQRAAGRDGRRRRRGGV